MPKTFTLRKIAILSVISATVIYAFTNNDNFIEDKPNTHIGDTYKYITTNQLEKEVEEHSVNGDLPFEMGLELIKRWTEK